MASTRDKSATRRDVQIATCLVSCSVWMVVDNLGMGLAWFVLAVIAVVMK